MSLKGRVAVVTGSGRGIGAATAILLAKRGANVVLNYVKNQERAESVRKEIMANGGSAIAVQADMTSQVGAEHLVHEALEKYGTVDILFSNAAPLFGSQMLAEMTWEEFSRILNGDMKSAFYATKAVLPTMVKNHFGRIIYTGSSSARKPTPGLSHHGTAKAAVIAFAEYVAKEYGPHGITANVVSPGMVETDRTMMLEQMKHHLSSVTPVGRIAKPEDIARVVTFFAEAESDFFTGTYFPVDGGLTL